MATAHKLENISCDELTVRALNFRKRIATEAKESESRKKISKELFDEAREKEFFRFYQPSRFGGLEYDHTPTPMLWSLEWSSADASTGWVLGLGVVHQWLISQFPMKLQEEVF